MPAKKSAAKKAPSKTTASKTTASSKKAPARRSVAPARSTTKKAAAKKDPAADSAAVKTAKSTPPAAIPPAVPATAPAANNTPPAHARKKASEFLTRPSHTPAIFKPSRRTAPVLFTLEDVRELLKKRLREETKPAVELPTAGPDNAGPTAPAKTAAADPTAVKTAKPVSSASKHAAASLDDILGLTSSIGVRKPPANKEILAKYRHYYQLLVELRKQVGEEFALHSSDTLKRSQKEDSGDLSISVDAGTDNFDRDFALSLLSTEQEALKEIDAAIQRIYKGTYGVCEITGQPIDKERLEAVPFTRFSLEGQKQFESTARRRTDRAGAYLNDGAGDSISFGEDDSDS